MAELSDYPWLQNLPPPPPHAKTATFLRRQPLVFRTTLQLSFPVQVSDQFGLTPSCHNFALVFE
jgi:hypothetical protein